MRCFWDVCTGSLAPGGTAFSFGLDAFNSALLGVAASSYRETNPCQSPAQQGRAQSKTHTGYTLQCVSYSNIIYNTRSSSGSLVSKNEACWEGLVEDFFSDSRCLRLRSLLASLTAAWSLSSERVVKLMELLVLSTLSRSSDRGRSLSIKIGAGGPTRVARLLALAGMASLKSSWGVQDTIVITSGAKKQSP